VLLGGLIWAVVAGAAVAGSSRTSDYSPAKAQAELAKYTNFSNIKMPKPKTPVAAGKHRVAIISCGQAGIGCQIMSQGLRDAVKAAGWTASPLFDGKFDPAVQAKAIRTAVQQNYDAIFLTAIDTASVRSAVDAAVAKGIPIFCNTCQSDGYKGKVWDVGADGYADGTALAWWIIAKSKGQAKIIAIRDKAFTIVVNRVTGFQRTIKANCPSCEVDLKDMATTELASPGPPTFKAALSAHPQGTVDYAVAPYDAATIPMGTTVAQSGRTDVSVTGYEALPPTQQVMKSGKLPVGVSVVLPYYFASWLMVDLAARKLNHLPLYSANHLPVRLVTPSTVGVLANGNAQVGYAFKPYFKKLWAKKS